MILSLSVCQKLHITKHVQKKRDKERNREREAAYVCFVQSRALLYLCPPNACLKSSRGIFSCLSLFNFTTNPLNKELTQSEDTLILSSNLKCILLNNIVIWNYMYEGAQRSYWKSSDLKNWASEFFFTF